MPLAHRPDPYQNFKFRVRWDGRYVAGFSNVSALKRTTAPMKHREGGDQSTGGKSPGRSKYDAITLERGVTHDSDFEKWANSLGSSRSKRGSGVTVADIKKDVIIEQYDEAGQLRIAYKIHRCWVSEFQSLPSLDAGANAVTIEHLKLENEGWARDDDEVAEPTEPPSSRRRPRS